ncbi:hypothetical protein CWO91_41010 [Bradyrhizobium genosp. SA-3]|nr:hypothetical protein CWO91_41010 [Bradyrhizobium genosp. SA-3]
MIDFLKQVELARRWSPDTVRRFRERFEVRSSDWYGMTEIGYGTQTPDIEDWRTPIRSGFALDFGPSDW